MIKMITEYLFTPEGATYLFGEIVTSSSSSILVYV